MLIITFLIILLILAFRKYLWLCLLRSIFTLIVENKELLKLAGSFLSESKNWGLLEYAVAIQLLKWNRSIDDIDRAINIAEQVIASTPDDHPNRARCFYTLSMALQIRFERTRSIDDLDRAIRINEQAVMSPQDDHPIRVMCLYNLGATLQIQFERTGSIDDLDQAIMMKEQVVASIPHNHSDRAIYLNNLGKALHIRFERTRSIDDLDRAIRINEQAVISAQDDHPIRVMCLNNLGATLQIRFERTGSIDDLDQAIMMKEQAVASITHDHPDRAIYLNNLGNALQIRFERTGSMNDLDQAITMKEQAVASTPDDHENQAMCLHNLSAALQSRFERTGSIDDLDRSIRTNEQAVASIPDDHPDRAMCLHSLGNALQSRFQRTGSIDDLDWAIRTSEQAVASMPDDDPNRATYLGSLGNALQHRFERTGSIGDLDRAVRTAEEAVVSTQDYPRDRAMCFNTLGLALRIRFKRTGSIDDLDRAIRTHEQAVISTPDDHPDRAIFLHSLGSALHSRFEWTGSTEDLDRAIRTKEHAVASIPDDHPDWAMHLNNLGIALKSRFERTGSIDDLDRAIRINEQAVTFIPDDHPKRAMCLHSLGSVLQSRFKRTGLMSDLDRAIRTNEQALASTPDDLPNRAMCLNNLGLTLQIRFQRTESIDNLNHAIRMIEQAVASAPDDDPDRAMYLDNLGTMLQSRFQRTGSMDDLDRAITAHEQAFQMNVAPPSVRLKAANSCSNLLIRQLAYGRAKAILCAAVHLLPMVSPRTLRRSDQQSNISQFAGITSRAVSLSLEDGEKPYHSLQLLELGRGILSNLQLEIRSDISSLAACHPDLAKKFQEVRDKIDMPLMDSPLMSDSLIDLDLSISINERRTLIKQFEDIIRSIRSLDGFNNFLQGSSELELRRLAENGSIVVFNISNIRSDAFLITTDNIRSVNLPRLTSDSVWDNGKRFLNAINGRGLCRYRHAKREMNIVLGWLWKDAVKPVLDELGFTQMPPQEAVWPRVWWVASGPLSILPIHASGFHDSSPPETALDRVISSYAPSLKSLAFSRERETKLGQVTVKEKAMLVSMQMTPEQPDLPFAKIEVENLERFFSKAGIEVTILQNPTRTKILSELSEYTAVHFACHGYPANDPSQSSLLLEDWKSAPLTVSDILSLNIQSGKFAYLSSCHTSATRDFRLLDESITLASAIQLCGYPSVVASLWQVTDHQSAEVSKILYEWILGASGLEEQRSAEGLHKAVRILRDRTRIEPQNRLKLSDPLVWGPYIHVGI